MGKANDEHLKARIIEVLGLQEVSLPNVKQRLAVIEQGTILTDIILLQFQGLMEFSTNICQQCQITLVKLYMKFFNKKINPTFSKRQ